MDSIFGLLHVDLLLMLQTSQIMVQQILTQLYMYLSQSISRS
nr:MAG TPA: hypothetical protein [Caudoviricetes sp.]